MQRSFILLACTATLLMLAAFSTRETATAPQAVLKVESAREGREVQFEGKYFSTGQAAFHRDVEVSTTPFEVVVDADEFVALFRSLDESAPIKLSVYVADGSSSVSAAATGEVGLILREGMKLTSGGL